MNDFSWAACCENAVSVKNLSILRGTPYLVLERKWVITLLAIHSANSSGSRSVSPAFSTAGMRLTGLLNMQTGWVEKAWSRIVGRDLDLRMCCIAS